MAPEALKACLAESMGTQSEMEQSPQFGDGHGQRGQHEACEGG